MGNLIIDLELLEKSQEKFNFWLHYDLRFNPHFLGQFA
jgi:hypothetical protein